MSMNGKYVVGLDVGTTKICTVVGEVSDDGIEIVGFGNHPSRGLRKGIVVDMDATVESIKRSVEEAEEMIDFTISSGVVGIAGTHISGVNSNGMITLRNREVTERDIRRVIESAKAISIPADREVIHVMNQEFIIDNQGGILQPLGMHGTRFEVRVHVVTGAVSAVQNLIKCCNRAGINVDDIVLQSIASAESVLTPDEKEFGVVLIDIGGGTTDVAVFYGGTLRYTAEIGIAGNHITTDIATAFKISYVEAEEQKKRFGCAKASLVEGADEIISHVRATSGATIQISREQIAQVIQDRLEELFQQVKAELINSKLHTPHYSLLGVGCVLTGGTSELAGIEEIASEILELPVRKGNVINIKGGLSDMLRSPIYATGVGLTLYSLKTISPMRKSRFRIRDRGFFSKIKQRMASWFGSFF